MNSKIVKSVSLVALAAQPSGVIMTLGEDFSQTSATNLCVVQRADYITKTEDSFPSITKVISSLESSRFTQVYTPRVEWANSDERRYDELVAKEALEFLTHTEQTELNSLQHNRRNSINPPSGEDILFRYKTAKLDAEMLELLKKRIRYASHA